MRLASVHIDDCSTPRCRSSALRLCKMLAPLWLHSVTAAFVISLQPAIAADVFPLGSAHIYRLESTTLLNELVDEVNHTQRGNGTDVGFQISGNMHVEAIWTDDTATEKLLRVHVSDWQLRTSGGTHKLTQGPQGAGDVFFIVWHDGQIEKLLMRREDPDVKNFKKGLATLLQFRRNSVETDEVDVQGPCHVVYSTTTVTDLTEVTKQKYCPLMQDATLGLLSSDVASSSVTLYTLSSSGQLKSVGAHEEHLLSLPSYDSVGALVSLQQQLVLQKVDQATHTIDATSLNQAEQILMETEDLSIEALGDVDYRSRETKDDFAKLVIAHRAALKGGKMIAEAKAALRLVTAARQAAKEDVFKVLKDGKNAKILPQLLDILGFAQTTATHATVSKLYHLDNEKQSDFNERYLWALSFSMHPNEEIMQDLLHKFKNTLNIPEKVGDSLISSLASMARNRRLHAGHDPKIYYEIESTIVNYLDATKGTSKRQRYLRALINLQSPKTIPLLLDITERHPRITQKQNQTKKKDKKDADSQPLKEMTMAWRAILLIMQREQERTSTDVVNSVRRRATATFLQTRAREDSSSRTIAFDILLMTTQLQFAPSIKDIEATISMIVEYLRQPDTDSEVQQYVLQRLRVVLDQNYDFARMLDQRMRSDKQIFNYHALAPKGLSVAMATDVYTQENYKETPLKGGLSTVQEIQQGFVKRGVVSVTLKKGKSDFELFGLGIFSSGLGSFISSGDGAESEGDAMAGMELSVMGTHLRPFMFFTGQGELMGHVWSGTGSERTTAFQALTLLHDHQQRLRLGNGLLVDVDVKSAASVDLSGQITISLWYRNADAKVEKSAGIFTLGILRLDTSFVSSQIEFSTSLEPKLELLANVDFSSSNAQLCMRLSQPSLEYAHNVYKIERIIGSKHKLRQRVRRRRPLPGKTYALNKKNADMCNAIYS